MDPPLPEDTTSLLRSKAILLVQREKELFVMRRKHAKTASWLSALRRISEQVHLRATVEDACATWAEMIVTELHLAAAVVLRARDGAAELELVAARGHDGPRARVPLDARLRTALARTQVMVCNDAGDMRCGAIGAALALDRFAAFVVRLDTGEVMLLGAGFDAPTVAYSERFDDQDVRGFGILGEHTAALLDNIDLVSQLERERSRLAAVNAALEDEVTTRTRDLKGANQALADRVRELDDALRERTRLEASLRAAERLASVGTLASGVAHEINNPLSYVLANLELIGERIAAAPDEPLLRDIGELAEEARQGADRVRRIVIDLKAFARTTDEELRTLDLHAVVDRAVTLVAHEIRARAVVERSFGAVPRVRASEGRLVQVFVNLLLNAAQAITEGHAAANVIRVETSTDRDGDAVVVVADTGSGISPEHLPRIFEPFYTTKAVGEGTGLGLYVCVGLVRAFGGDITVESNVGGGTSVRVVLPAASRTNRSHPGDGRPP